MRKFNWLDAVIILCVIALIGAGVFYFRRTTATTARETKKIRVSVEVKARPYETVTGFKKGDQVVYGAKSIDVGTIYDAIILESEKIGINTMDGVFTLEKVPNKYDAIVMIDIDGVETADQITSNNEELSIGMETVFHGKGFAASGIIVGIDTEVPQ